MKHPITHCPTDISDDLADETEHIPPVILVLRGQKGLNYDIILFVFFFWYVRVR